MTAATARQRSAPTVVAAGLAMSLMTTLAFATIASEASAGTTILSANFDSLATGQMKPQDFMNIMGGTNSSTYYYDDTTIAADSRGSGKVIRTTLRANSYHTSPSGNNGITIFPPLSRTVDAACIAYDIKFSSGFPWSKGGKLPGLIGVRPGIAPGTPTGGGKPGDKGWSGRLMWHAPASGSTDGKGLSYMYSASQSSYYGDDIMWNRNFVDGKWHRVQQCFQMNTVGASNGILRASIDGTQIVNKTNYVYRTRSDVHINYLSWAIFRGGNDSSWAASKDGSIDIDNLLITEGVSGSSSGSTADRTTSTTLVSDSFERSASSSWGSASTGGAWTETGGSSLFSVASGTGRLKLASPGSGPRSTLAALSTASTDSTVSFTLDKRANGGGVFASIASRATSTGADAYRAKAKVASDGRVTLILSRVIGGAETDLGTYLLPSSVTVAAGEKVKIRLQTQGTSPTTLRAKVWKAGASEPSSWQLSRTDSTSKLQSSRGAGLAGYLSSSTTNQPVVVKFDDFKVVKLG